MYLSIYLSIYLSVYLCLYFVYSADKVANFGIRAASAE